MFGCQARSPVDVMYRPIEQPLQSYEEYAKLLQRRLQRALDLVKQHITTEHLRQKEFYDQKIYGKFYTTEDLHSLVTFTSSKARLML